MACALSNSMYMCAGKQQPQSKDTTFESNCWLTTANIQQNAVHAGEGCTSFVCLNIVSQLEPQGAYVHITTPPWVYWLWNNSKAQNPCDDSTLSLYVSGVWLLSDVNVGHQDLPATVSSNCQICLTLLYILTTSVSSDDQPSTTNLHLICYRMPIASPHCCLVLSVHSLRTFWRNLNLGELLYVHKEQEHRLWVFKCFRRIICC